jgi:hypothetical protein
MAKLTEALPDPCTLLTTEDVAPLFGSRPVLLQPDGWSPSETGDRQNAH